MQFTTPSHDATKQVKLGNLRDLSLYLVFFPQLIAGPIIKAHYFWPQLKSKSFANIDWQRAVRYLICGYFMKMVVADRLALYVDNVYHNLDNANSISVFLAVIFFTFQIYCDFSGYTDIARGIARLMGF